MTFLDTSLLPVPSIMPISLSALSCNADGAPESSPAVFMLRLDQLGGDISGNKYFKLLGNLQGAKAAGATTLLSFGGVWSNHLHALAVAGEQWGFKTVGVVRGYADQLLTAMLSDCRHKGMELRFVDKGLYRQLRQDNYQKLPWDVSDTWVIPEGGDNAVGREGCEAIASFLKNDAEPWDKVILPCGTGASLQGLVAGLQKQQIPVRRIIGTGVLNNLSELRQALQSSAVSKAFDVEIVDGVFWGYGKLPPLLRQFMGHFEQSTGVLLDPIYTVKMLYWLKAEIETKKMSDGERILVIHTGGIQGRRGFSGL